MIFWLFIFIQKQNEMTEQKKILDSLNKQYDDEKSKVDELNASVQEIKAKMAEIKEELQSIQNNMEEKRKSKEELSESLTKRDSMIAYYQKSMKTYTAAVVQYEVCIFLRKKLT